MSGKLMSVHSTLAVTLIAASTLLGQTKEGEFVVPYVPSPDSVVTQMLELGELREGELHFDLGSGDGRIVLAAAGRFKARSVGFEIRQELVESSRKAVEQAGLAKLARIEGHDLFTADFREVDLITTYLLPAVLEKLAPILERQMKPGSRLVSHDYPVPGWTAEKTAAGKDDTHGLPYDVFLYRR